MAVLRAGRRTNTALSMLTLSAFASGVFAFGVGDAGHARVVTVAHGALGLGLLLLVPWKSLIVRRGLARTGRRRPTAGLALGPLLLVTIAAGLFHAQGGYHRANGVTSMTVHVAAAMLAVPFLVLHVRGRRQRLLAHGSDTVRAVLDCTGGWFADQAWRGLRLDRLVTQDAASARSIDVMSVTGYQRRLPLRDLERLLLATHVANVPLSPGHGGPVRLVAPGRRGFWWVKWVGRVEVTSEPWWLQPPLPLQ